MRILAQDKWGSQIWEGDEAALELLTKRVDEGFWYPEEDQTKAGIIVEDGDVGAAWNFLSARRNAEYEWVEEI